jgi:hypothetical protein
MRHALKVEPYTNSSYKKTYIGGAFSYYELNQGNVLQTIYFDKGDHHGKETS